MTEFRMFSLKPRPLMSYKVAPPNDYHGIRWSCRTMRIYVSGLGCKVFHPRVAVPAAAIASIVSIIGPAVRADFRRLYPANAKTPTCCPSDDDNRTKVTNSVTSARSLWWHVGPYFWPADLTRTANPIVIWPLFLRVRLYTFSKGASNKEPTTHCYTFLGSRQYIYHDIFLPHTSLEFRERIQNKTSL